MEITEKQAKMIVEILLKEEVLSKDELLTLMKRNPTPMFMNAVTSIHSLLCHREHDEANSDCMFYEEELMKDAWTKPCHLEWSEKTIELMELLKIDEAGVLRATSCIRDVMKDLGAVKGAKELVLLALESLDLSPKPLSATSPPIEITT